MVYYLQWIFITQVFFVLTPAIGKEIDSNIGSRFAKRSSDSKQFQVLPQRLFWWFLSGPTTTVSNGPSKKATVCACKEQYRRKRQAMNDTDDGELNARIVGGENTKANEYPEIVLVQLDERQHCAGVILNEKHIMTAAHCVVKQTDSNKFTVIVGAHDLKNLQNAVTYKVARGMYDPDYDRQTYDRDIAILELEKPIDFQKTGARVACVALTPRNYDKKMGTAVGWGKTSETGSAAQIQQKVNLPIISNDECIKMFENRYKITKDMLCAGYEEGGKDACGGDSGGPLFIQEKGHRLQAGITSFGEGCARAKRPGVYARVDQMTDFLRNNMPASGLCAISSPDYLDFQT